MPREYWRGVKSDIGIVALADNDYRDELRIVYVCRAGKGPTAGDRHALATFDHIRAVDPLDVDLWLDAVPSRFRSTLRFAIEDAGRPLPAATWAAARDALVRLRPELAPALDELDRLLSPQVATSPQRQRIYAAEKDAVGVALSIAGFDRGSLAEWSPPADDEAPWLEGLAATPAREDAMVTHDAERVEGWWPSAEPYVGVRTFQNAEGERLTVMNVNRHSIEHTLGVDLLYYRHEPASYTLVQYKRSAPRNRDNEDDPNAVFYPSSDTNFANELNRMRAADANVDITLPITKVSEYRLYPRACWIKLCDKQPFAPNGTDLIPGMYMPLDYYDALMQSDLTLGPQGARLIDRERLPRWITNTLFITLMTGGWIGSRGLHTDHLGRLIESTLAAHRSLVIAREDKETIRNRRWTRRVR